mmetsp:Transcript_68378/g.164111  ORF Transcript_68378/g.164111 Transcript_68378/m.164111 type:complete len:171 (+) Transcript_68378:58-570(+)
MGCGASGNQKNLQRKYEVQVDLNNIGDDSKQSLMHQAISSSNVQQVQQSSNSSDVPGGAAKPPKGGDRLLQGNRYLPGDVIDGVEIVEGGDVDLSQAQIAATDENLLKKYADPNAQGKKRPMNKRVFQPSNGPLSGELMGHAVVHEKAMVDEEYDSLQNHTVGALKLQYR